jgi:predicted Zn-dependent protease
MGENITIVDDAYYIKGYSFPFDFEGVPKKKLALIEKGVAKNIVYDSFTAGKEGRESTGHALVAPMNYPLPMHQRLLPGKSTVREMIASIKRGVLVTRFHYTNVLEPMRVVITGMTRDGTFLIEDGKVTKPVRNFRFTQSVLDALSCVSLIGKDAVLVGEETMYGARFAAGIVAPALKVDKFNFTGVTQF